MHTVFFQNHHYQLSDASMPEILESKLSKKDFQRYLELLQEIQKNPKKTYVPVKEFCLKHQNIPEVTNLLTYAHVHNKRIAEGEKLIETTWEKYPHYFIGKINYADLCLRRKQVEKIPTLFSSFILAELFPEKKSFHIAEFRSFMVLMGFYHQAIGKKNEAVEYLRAAQEIEPNHRSVLFLEKKLFPKSLLRCFLRMLRK